ncbi:hypothetical protein [Paracoccus zhejiangensis]|uniref:hypothetical protein n=1 Tax=Paracoccus zhejiangensis TaxID=1077935 RepID=UPI001E32D693|nr:hypothetical protein [Paracoccus zhejiangensis]
MAALGFGAALVLAGLSVDLAAVFRAGFDSAALLAAGEAGFRAAATRVFATPPEVFSAVAALASGPVAPLAADFAPVFAVERAL